MAISTQGQSLFSTALSLPPEERVEIAEQLLASVDDSQWSWENADPAWRAEWEAEIQRRIEEVRTGKSHLIDGELVMQELRERFSK